MTMRKLSVSDEQAWIERQKNILVSSTIEDLEKIGGDSLLSGDDSGLKSTWEEICVQVQQEESFFWDDYIATIEFLLLAKVEGLSLSERQLLWFSTKPGSEWQDENENNCTEDNLPPVFADEIVEDLKSDLLSIAGEYENSRITRYIYGEEEEEDLEDEECEEEDSDDNEDIDEDAENEPVQGSLFDTFDSVPMNPMILKALDLAAKAHATQLRKDTDTPYISHPTAVGMLLLHYGCSTTVIAAGILHDTVEDAGVSLDEINELFGAEVAAIVEACSEPDKEATWIPRKLHTIECLKTAPMNVKLTVAADKLHNVTCMLSDYEVHSEALWSRFKRGREDQEWYYRSVLESLGIGVFCKHPLYSDLKNAIDKMFCHIDTSHSDGQNRS